MKTYCITLSYTTEVEVEADSKEEAVSQLYDGYGDDIANGMSECIEGIDDLDIESVEEVEDN